jgi:uncharacterized protein YciI
MAFQLFCLDDPQKPALRSKIRPDHLRYMIAHKDRILFGGPLKSADGRISIGSAFALNYETREEVDRFLATEPYAQSGLFSTVLIHPIAVMVPERRIGFLEEELARELAGASLS